MKVRELLDSPEKWTKGAIARDSKGNLVSYNSPNAVCFCLLGAIYKCYASDKMNPDKMNPDKLPLEIRKLIGSLLNLRSDSISYFNDAPKRTFEDIKNLVNTLDI